MSRYLVVSVSFGILSAILLAVQVTECSGKERVLEPSAGTVTPLTDCLVGCSGMTYIRKMQLGDARTIRFKDSTKGDLGEYCWSTEVQCGVGESLERAYVVLPVAGSVAGQLQVRGEEYRPLQAHSGPSTVAHSCGLRYDATRHFSPEHTATTSFCIQMAAREDRALKCPPFLVTFWQ